MPCGGGTVSVGRSTVIRVREVTQHHPAGTRRQQMSFATGTVSTGRRIVNTRCRPGRTSIQRASPLFRGRLGRTKRVGFWVALLCWDCWPLPRVPLPTRTVRALGAATSGRATARTAIAATSFTSSTTALIGSTGPPLPHGWSSSQAGRVTTAAARTAATNGLRTRPRHESVASLAEYGGRPDRRRQQMRRSESGAGRT